MSKEGFVTVEGGKVLHNIVGVGGAKAFMNTPDREWELYFAINVYGMIYGIRAFV